jgi:hypothetical protein
MSGHHNPGALPGQPPGEFYDLTVRIHEAQAIASCALESLPSGLTGLESIRMNHTSLLISALEDILKLAHKDVETVAEYLHA